MDEVRGINYHFANISKVIGVPPMLAILKWPLNVEWCVDGKK